jgi:hypothetical protein
MHYKILTFNAERRHWHSMPLVGCYFTHTSMINQAWGNHTRTHSKTRHASLGGEAIYSRCTHVNPNHMFSNTAIHLCPTPRFLLAVHGTAMQAA